MKRVVFVIVSLLLLVTTSGRTQAPMEPVAKDVAVYSFNIHYVEAGRGAPVILLHGTGGEGARWMPTIKGLMNDFHVFAIDQIGFGQSDKPLTNLIDKAGHYPFLEHPDEFNRIVREFLKGTT